MRMVRQNRGEGNQRGGWPHVEGWTPARVVRSRPSIRTESCSETGKSGLVTFVGSENVGIARSTRSLSGATGILAGTVGCGIVVTVGPLGVVDPPEVEPVAFEPEGDAALLLPVHAPATNATETIRTSRRGRSDRSRRATSPRSPSTTPSVTPGSTGSVVVRAVLVVRPVVIGLEAEDPEVGAEPDLHHASVVQAHLDPVRGAVVASFRLGHRPPAGEPERGRSSVEPVSGWSVSPAPVAMATPAPPPTTASASAPPTIHLVLRSMRSTSFVRRR